jgi:8-oxo-dGTP diphosphatase
MSLPGQRIYPHRYTVIPRTLSFLTRGDAVLLLRLPPDRGAWAGKYNAIGGHIEQGEAPRESALREIREETGLTPDDLQLVGVLLIDTGDRPGVALYVFMGECGVGEPSRGSEGKPEWIAPDQLDRTQLLQDIPSLLSYSRQSLMDGLPFSGLYTYDEKGKLQMSISQPGRRPPPRQG